MTNRADPCTTAYLETAALLQTSPERLDEAQRLLACQLAYCACYGDPPRGGLAAKLKLLII